ncbi:MAG: hypothetical protein ACRDE5_14365, partial [Ginsengibacter sp.]
CVFSTCKKGGVGCTESSIYFTVDAKVYPDKDSINVGDTIFVEINIPTTLPDQFNKMINYSKANNLGTDMGFVKLVNASPIQLDDAVPYFTFYLISGKETPSPSVNLIKEYLFEETGGRYLFKLAIIPKNGGTYSFNLGSAVNVIREGNSCPKASFNFLLKNTTDQHYYLYPGGSWVTPAGADYYFYVR